MARREALILSLLLFVKRDWSRIAFSGRAAAPIPGAPPEFAAMSDDRCKFCKSTIDDANDIHSKGGWADKWDQEIVSMTYYEKLEGYEYNRVKVIVNYGAMASYYGDGQNPSTSEATYGQEVNFGVRYNNGRWMVGAVEAVSK